MTKFYTPTIHIDLIGGAPTPSIKLVEDVHGTVAKRDDVEAVGPTADGDVQAKLDRLVVLEAEHAALLATLNKT